MQYLADLTQQSGLAPPAGSWQRVRLQEWLNFISSEIHAGSALLFDTAVQDAVLAIVREKLFKRFDYLQEVLAGKAYLMGASFSVADAYLFTVLSWCKYFTIELDRWSALVAYRAAINTRPAVQAALLAETMQ